MMSAWGTEPWPTSRTLLTWTTPFQFQHEAQRTWAVDQAHEDGACSRKGIPRMHLGIRATKKSGPLAAATQILYAALTPS
jgi:hypothetical protein